MRFLREMDRLQREMFGIGLRDSLMVFVALCAVLAFARFA